MGTAQSARRFAIASAFTVVAGIAAVAPVIAIPAGLSAQQAGCANGEEGDLYTGACVPYLVPNTPGASSGCPPGVSGAECTGQAAAPPPPAPTPFQPSPELQELEDVATPGY